MRRRTLARRRAEVLLDVEPETGTTTSSSPGLVLPFDPLRLIDAVVRRWWLMLIAGAALAAGMFVVGYKRFETLHTARAQIIKQETASAFRQSESGEAFRPRDMTIPTFIKLMHNGNVVEAAAARLKGRYEEQVIRTFFVSHADATELAQLVNTVILAPQMAIQPRIAANKTANTITVRASAPVADIIEKIIRTNDKPRAEVVVDVQILEVSRERAKRYGLNLTDYALGSVFSPEQLPAGSTASTGTGTGGTGTTTTSTGSGTAPSNVTSPAMFNANTISTGISAADFYLAVPAAISPERGITGQGIRARRRDKDRGMAILTILQVVAASGFFAVKRR